MYKNKQNYVKRVYSETFQLIEVNFFIFYKNKELLFYFSFEQIEHNFKSTKKVTSKWT